MSVELVAEVGSNWNGSLSTAVDLIQAAAAAGADTVKFQHYPDERYGPHPLSREDLVYLSIAAQASNLGFLCSVFDRRTLTEYVEECSPARVKIASPELTDYELLENAAFAGLGIVLSTGMSTKAEISEALNACGTRPVILLHCVSSYPAPPEELNIRAMKGLRGYRRPVGLSDHTLDPIVAPVAATALGAMMIEKHFTLDRDQVGPDHSYALDPPDFKRMVDAVRLAELMLGDGVKRVMPSEDPTDRRTAEWRAA